MAVRKVVLLIAVIVFLVSFSSPASAGGDPLRKLGRGLSNCVSFPMEIPSQISKVNNSDGPVAAFTYGIIKGVTMCAFRAVVGAYEIVTFPIPFPRAYKPILTDPEFMLENINA